MSALGESLDASCLDLAEQLRLAREDLEAAARAFEAKRAHVVEIESRLEALALQARRARRPRYYMSGERRLAEVTR